MDRIEIDVGGQRADTRITWVEAGKPPAGLDTLLELERLLLRKGRPASVDPVRHVAQRAAVDRAPPENASTTMGFNWPGPSTA